MPARCTPYTYGDQQSDVVFYKAEGSSLSGQYPNVPGSVQQDIVAMMVRSSTSDALRLCGQFEQSYLPLQEYRDIGFHGGTGSHP